MSQIKLKPCPFCGEKAGYNNPGWPGGELAYCDNEKCGMYGIYVVVPTSNTRALDITQTPDAALVEALEGILELYEKPLGCVVDGAEMASIARQALAQHQGGPK